MTRKGTRAMVGAGALGVLAIGGVMVSRSRSPDQNAVRARAPRSVSVAVARAETFRRSRTFIGTLEPWVTANVGPELVSAYVTAVLVRPGAPVHRGDVLATLDCRNASAGTRAVAAQARAVDARLRASAGESARYNGLLDGGFVAVNDAEQKNAQRSAQEAELGAARAALAGKTLEVDDCVLRAPFDGEIATRTVDPGAFVRPGTAIVSVIDRSTIRLTGDAPEIDFATVAPATPVSVTLLATGTETRALISRRAPSADAGTRTIHFEIDLPNAERIIPVNTTAEVRVEIGAPVEATEIPVFAASVRGKKATLFVVEGGVARSRTVLVRGESGGSLFVDGLAPGSGVVSEGRSMLSDGDRVDAHEDPAAARRAAAKSAEALP